MIKRTIPRGKFREVCLACEKNTLRPKDGNNSYSRYCDAYICSKCGVEEAFSGFFWSIRARAAGVKLSPAGHEALTDGQHQI